MKTLIRSLIYLSIPAFVLAQTSEERTSTKTSSKSATTSASSVQSSKTVVKTKPRNSTPPKKDKKSTAVDPEKTTIPSTEMNEETGFQTGPSKKTKSVPVNSENSKVSTDDEAAPVLKDDAPKESIPQSTDLPAPEAKSQEKGHSVLEEVKEAHRDFTKRAETLRGENRYFGALEWTPLDLFIPVKFGAHVGLNANANHSYELEYIRGSLSVPFIIDDLGSVVDDRFTLTSRHFFGGTFNLFYGLDYLRFRIHLGDEIIRRISALATPDVDVLELGGWGAHVGLGNRWALGKNVTFGVDWFSWTQPLYTSHRKAPYLGYVTNDNDKDNVRDVLKFVEYFPRFTLLKFSLGASF